MNADAGVLGGKSVKVLLEENVLGANVGEDEVDLGLVSSLSATNNSADDLKHGGDSSATSDHTKVSDHVRSVDESALGAADLDSLTDNERGHVLGYVALGV